MFAFVDPPNHLTSTNDLRQTLSCFESSVNVFDGWYAIRFGNWREMYDNLGRQLREHGVLRGLMRAFFQQTSGLGYVISQYPGGGWEFVDYLLRQRERGPLDQLFVENPWAWGIRHRAQIVQDLLAQFINERRVQDEELAVLDLGCGPGHLALHVAQLGAQHVVGVDYDPRAIQIAKSRADQHGLNGRVHFEHEDAFQYLANTPEDFDLALVIGLIAYLDDDKAIELLAGVRRRLRKGGWLITNNTSSQVNPLLLRWAHLMGLNGLRGRSAEELHRLLAEAGYQRIRLITDPSGTQHMAVGKVESRLQSTPRAHVVEWVPIAQLRDHEEVETERVQSLANEIQKRRRVAPLLVEKTHGVILDGHHRKEALRLLGLSRAPCLRVDYAHVRLGHWHSDLSPTKEEVIHRALRGERFPPKTTRHTHDFQIDEVALETLNIEQVNAAPESRRNQPTSSA